MRKTIFSLFFTLIAVQMLVAQDSLQQVLLTIDGQEITIDEFARVYKKNNQDAIFDKASLDEYMKLFINFKLKVMEAEALGMDTLPSFVKELKGYKVQLEKPYFTDESTDDLLILEAYNRMGLNIRASHILLKCDENTLPKDTLLVYNKIKNIRKRALKGEDFAALAKANSEDPSVEKNGGDLGYFSAFAMVYPFETAAYNTPVGEVSEIFRTRFGYHILKVVDRRKDLGQVKVAHIMRSLPNEITPEEDKKEFDLITALRDSVLAGESFSVMAQNYSADRGSSRNGGELGYFHVGKMVPEFEKAAFALDTIGQISPVIRTQFGYHFLKLIDKDSLSSLEKMRPIIVKNMSKDIRAERGKEMVIKRLCNEYNVSTNKKALTPFYTMVDSTIFFGSWLGAKLNENEILFTIADTIKITQEDFAKYLTLDKRIKKYKPLEIIVNDLFDEYLEKNVIDFEKSQLENKYPEYKNLVKEYHDGILLFNLTDKMVWTKAVEDSAGLEAFYSQNSTNYMWGERLKATIYTYNKPEMAKKINSLALKTGKKNIDVHEAKAAFLAKELAKDSTLLLKVEQAKYSKGENDIIDGVIWEAGIKQVIERDSLFVLVYVNEIVAPEPKKLNEARGLITADYQTYLEEQWIAVLREKYKVEVKQEVFESMIK